MKRIMVIGCCGAGKSTLARKLHHILGLPLIHLDQVYWRANWVEPSQAVWRKQVEELVQQKEQWIMDGNYGGTMDLRIPKAEMIVLMDFPTRTALYRVLKRTWKHYGQERPDMPKGCKERFDLHFLWYVLTYNYRKRPALLKRLEKAEKNSSKQIIHLRNDDEVQAFINQF